MDDISLGITLEQKGGIPGNNSYIYNIKNDTIKVPHTAPTWSLRLS